MADKGNDKSDDGKPAILVGQYQHPPAEGVGGQSNIYNGLRIHTTPGLHNHLGDIISQYSTRGGTAVDLGAGTGALVSRLRDMGFEPIAVDYVAENFQLHDSVNFIRTDLNSDFSQALALHADLVTAVEIIEHVENPRHFLREAAKLCKPGGGKILLTTPSTDNPVSKALFCRSGNHMWFGDKDYDESGHITPLSRWQIRKMAEEIGLDYLYEGSFGDPFSKLNNRPRIKEFAQLIQRKSNLEPAFAGEVYVAVLALRG